jgi:hypothetical protein
MEITLETSEVLILIKSFSGADEGRRACEALAARHIVTSMVEHDAKPRPFDVYVPLDDAVEAFTLMQ